MEENIKELKNFSMVFYFTYILHTAAFEFYKVVL